MKSPIILKSHLKKFILISIVSFQVISISKVGNYDSDTLISVLINQQPASMCMMVLLHVKVSITTEIKGATVYKSLITAG